MVDSPESSWRHDTCDWRTPTDPEGPLDRWTGSDDRPDTRVGTRAVWRGLRCGVTATVAARPVVEPFRGRGGAAQPDALGRTRSARRAQPDALRGCSTSMYMLVAPIASRTTITTAAAIRKRFGSRR